METVGPGSEFVWALDSVLTKLLLLQLSGHPCSLEWTSNSNSNVATHIDNNTVQRLQLSTFFCSQQHARPPHDHPFIGFAHRLNHATACSPLLVEPWRPLHMARGCEGSGKSCHEVGHAYWWAWAILSCWWAFPDGWPMLAPVPSRLLLTLCMVQPLSQWISLPTLTNQTGSCWVIPKSKVTNFSSAINCKVGFTTRATWAMTLGVFCQLFLVLLPHADLPYSK